MMKVSSLFRVFSAFSIGVGFSFGLGLGLGSAVAQQELQGMSSKLALAELEQIAGGQALAGLVSMKGVEGVPQPAEWEVVCHDAASPTLLHRYRVGPGYVRDEGQVEDAYPTKEPAGFIDYSQLRLDSIGAFTVAEVAATQAKMGFDSLNLTLRCREYSREPVWILHLIDSDGFLVGKVHISGNSARVFRTIWIYRDELIEGIPRVEDSALLPSQDLTQQGQPGEPGQPSIPAPLTPGVVEAPRSIIVEPGADNFVPPVPGPAGPQMVREPVPLPDGRTIPAPPPPFGTNGSPILPPIPKELLQDPTIPDTRIPPPP